MKVTKNNEQQLYVLNYGKYVSCLGYEVCRQRAERLAKELGLQIEGYPVGSLKMYRWYQKLLKVAGAKHKQTGWKSSSELIPEFIGREGQRVEVVDADGNKRRFYIGKSTGFIPCHLEIPRNDSTGGVSVSGYPFRSVTYLGLTRY